MRMCCFLTRVSNFEERVHATWVQVLDLVPGLQRFWQVSTLEIMYKLSILDPCDCEHTDVDHKTQP